MKTLLKLIKKNPLSGGFIFILLNFKFLNSISIPNIKHRIFLRKRTSDVATFIQIFVNQEYDRIPIKFSPKTIIDLGGNIGLAAIFFANKYPESKIISIEPEDSNYKMLAKNSRNHKNITTLNKAISNENNITVQVEDNGYGKWGFMTKKTNSSPENGIKTISIDSLMKQNTISIIDILKIDIEGAEKELFESNYESWIPKTRCIVIELHDRMKSGCSKSFFKCISEYNFSFNIRGENIVMINNDI
tara:strand:+ start:178 stop:915 length:738 start_codon:yes stop_codon:yes gene_type:complete